MENYPVHSVIYVSNNWALDFCYFRSGRHGVVPYKISVFKEYHYLYYSVTLTFNFLPPVFPLGCRHGFGDRINKVNSQTSIIGFHNLARDRINRVFLYKNVRVQ